MNTVTERAGSRTTPPDSTTHNPTTDPARDTQLVEIVTPRTNSAAVSPAENLFAAISLPEPFSLEIAATRDARWFLARAGGAMRAHLEDQLGAAYPQAELRRLDPVAIPGLDPARRAPDEQVAACAFGLRRPEYLPLRMFTDLELASDRAAHAAQADPLLGVLGAMGDLPDGWRSLSQLVLRPAGDDWCRDYLRLAVDPPRESGRGGDGSLLPVFMMAGLLGLGSAALRGYRWYQAGDWLRLALLAAGILVALVLLAAIARRLSRREVYDRRLVADKIGRIAYEAHLRIAVFAPCEVPRPDVVRRLDQLAAAYRQFNLAAGNGLRPVPLRLDPRDEARGEDLRTLATLRTGRVFGRAPAPVLNTRELAGIWHLPQARADVPLVERTAARKWLPLPAEVRPNPGSCRIGTSSHLGRAVPVALPPDLLARHLLLVAKTRRGKSSLLTHLARHVMSTDQRSGALGEGQRALVLVDPHRDLARAVLGLVPPGRRRSVVYLDAANAERPFGINLIDVGLGWGRDKAVSNALALFRREFDQFWGPRMEDAFRFALLTLYEANEAICRDDPRGGRHRQHTVLQVPWVLSVAAFREKLLERTTDRMIDAWWHEYFDRLPSRLQLEIINPVQTKVSRFAGSRTGRAVVGQPCSTIDPAAWLRDGSIVIVHTAKGVVGEDVAALVGGCIVNLAGLVVGQQAALPERERKGMTLIVDEFHSMPGADYEGILAELAKFGCNLVLATQSLSKLQALDRDQRRTLRATVFSNLDGLFAFHVSAEDAQYLVKELGGELEIPDLVEMGEHRCYAKISARGTRLPVFSVELDPPLAGDAAVADHLAAESAGRYGRAAARIQSDLDAALERVRLNRLKEERSKGSKEQHGKGERDGRSGRGGAAPPRARNDGRPHADADADADARPPTARPSNAGGSAAVATAPAPVPPGDHASAPAVSVPLSNGVFHQATLFAHAAAAGRSAGDEMFDGGGVDITRDTVDDEEADEHDDLLAESERGEWDSDSGH
ncbi:MAG TPA: hypothetical protein VFN74_03385 [Chloroflexota bacterium]|nr:hypothetical protein [Chloroflexota bacterium]